MEVFKNIGFGCVSLTLLPFQHDAIKLLDTAYDQGIRHFDTAPLYGNGYSEKIVGKFLRTKKGKVTVATKFGLSPKASPSIPAWLALPLHALKNNIKGTKPGKFSIGQPSVVAYRRIEMEEVKSYFEKSIKALGTGHINYYLLHEALPSFLTDEAFSYLQSLKQKGDVGQIGVATNAVSILHLTAQQYQGWDVLQYENGLAFSSDNLIQQYPEQQHFYHSVFKGAQARHDKILNRGNVAGLLMAKACRNNPSGKILFGTSKIANLKKNMAAFAAARPLNDAMLNYQIQDAIL